MSLETGLAGKRALITGGGSGIGRAIAMELAMQGVGGGDRRPPAPA